DRHDLRRDRVTPATHPTGALVVDDPHARRRRARDDAGASGVVEMDKERPVSLVDVIVDQWQTDALRRLASRELENPGGCHVIRTSRGRGVGSRVAYARGLRRGACAGDVHDLGAVCLGGAVAYRVEAHHTLVQSKVRYSDVVDVVVRLTADRARREVRAALVRHKAADREPIDDGTGRPTALGQRHGDIGKAAAW